MAESILKKKADSLLREAGENYSKARESSAEKEFTTFQHFQNAARLYKESANVAKQLGMDEKATDRRIASALALVKILKAADQAEKETPISAPEFGSFRFYSRKATESLDILLTEWLAERGKEADKKKQIQPR